METIADALEAHSRVRETLMQAINGLSQEQLTARPEGEKWSIQEIVEHIALVDEGTGRICAKLVGGAKAAGKSGDGRINLSAEFVGKSQEIAGMKVEAPERVHPTGGVPIKESLARMEQTAVAVESLRSDLETFDLADHKFPHPYFGPITAAEWLVLAGGHANRHIKQIERMKGQL